MRRVSAAVCLSLALAACQPTPTTPAPISETAPASAPRENVIRGTATYRERLMLPSGSVLRVDLIDNQLADSAAAVIATIETPVTQGPPIAFTLPFDPGKLRPSGDYGLHASIRDGDGQLWFVTDTRTPATPGSTAPVRLTLLRVEGKTQASMVDTRWQCGEQKVAARFDAAPTSAVTLNFGERTLVLPQAQSASGARYADTSGNEFWNKGRASRLTLAGKAAVECRQIDTASPWDAARSRNVAFRAVGNEPGWLVEVGDGAAPTLHAELDYGEHVIDVASLGGGDGQWSGKSADGADVALSVDRSTCQDGMSGEDFPATATLRVGDKTYSGCGRYLGQ